MARRRSAPNHRTRGPAMKGDPKVLDYLNRGLRSELTAINQYWLHYRILEDWGYRELAKTWRKESIEEMHHADRFVERILFLDGFPNLQVLDPLRIGQNVQEVIECDLAAEHDGVAPTRPWRGRVDAAGQRRGGVNARSASCHPRGTRSRFARLTPPRTCGPTLPLQGRVRRDARRAHPNTTAV